MTVFNDLKGVAGVLHEAGKIEQYQQILSAQQEMLEMQFKIGELTTENQELKNRLEISGSLEFRDNSYWILKEDDQYLGPYCSGCWDSKEKLVHLHTKTNKAIVCPNCGKEAKPGEMIIL